MKYDNIIFRLLVLYKYSNALPLIYFSIIYPMRSQCITKLFWSDANISIDICSHENLRIPWLIRDELINFTEKLLLFIYFLWMVYCPNVSLNRFDVTPTLQLMSAPMRISKFLGRFVMNWSISPRNYFCSSISCGWYIVPMCH